MPEVLDKMKKLRNLIDKKKLNIDIEIDGGINFDNSKKAKEFGAETENGKMMFIYQAQKAFFTWHNILPAVDNETLNLLNV